MKVALILPGVGSFHKLRIHFGLAYIAGYLKTDGYNDILFLAVEKTEDYTDIVNRISGYKPDVVGFTSVETQFAHVLALSKLIKQAHECIVVCGGTFPTIYPDCIKDAPYLDGIFIGESEKAFLEFVRFIDEKKDYRCCENFCYLDKNTGEICKNSLFPQEKELDKIGYPDRDIFNFQNVIDFYSGSAPFLFNRGCPYDCSFCSNHALASVYGKKSNLTRRRTVDSCISEIKQVNEKYSFKAIDIWDDLFISDRKWLYDFLDKYKSNINKPFMCTAHSNLCDDELFRNLRENGCYRIHMAIESGNEFIRNKILNRNISQEKLIESYRLAKKYGLEINATAVVGIPFETEDMIKETIRLLGRLKVDSTFANILYPYQGTRIRELCEQFGMMDTKKLFVERERRESVLKLPHVDQRTLYYYRDNFDLLVKKERNFFIYLSIKARKILVKILRFILRDRYAKYRKIIVSGK